MTDMLFKYFLGYDPEETKLIDPSLLTVFRRERLIDNDTNLMDKLIEKTVELALEKGLIEVKNKIIVIQHIQMQCIVIYHQEKN